MKNNVEAIVTIVPVTCCECGVVFGLEAGYRKQRLNDHKDWTCPNGHRQHYTVVTRMKKRVGAGVCPHPGCKRHFTNLEAHMATKHPEFVTGDES